jgi:hypothetical protein
MAMLRRQRGYVTGMPEVPGGAAADAVVAVAFLLFFLSIVSAAATELLASAFNWRGRMLRQGLERWLGSERAATLYDAPRLRMLHGPRGRLPSYIPPGVASEVDGFGDLMDRMTGWYKRRIQWTVLLVALLGIVLLNVDAFALGGRFLEDDAIKQAVVARAQDGSGDAGTAAAEVAAVTQLDLPFGWRAQNRPDDLLGWLGKLAAWVITAISIPIGASFWFDVLSKFSRQRGAGIRYGAPTRDDVDEDGRP